MPKLSRFFGIDIYMPSREAGHPLPHFHAKYTSERISIAIGTLEVLAGKNPRKGIGDGSRLGFRASRRASPRMG
jgi:hypothetical protein